MLLKTIGDQPAQRPFGDRSGTNLLLVALAWAVATASAKDELRVPTIDDLLNVDSVGGVRIAPAGIEFYLPLFFEGTATLFDYLPPNAVIVHDAALQDLPVIFCRDRAGLSPQDGPTHHGLFDIAYLRHVPNCVLMAPKD